MAISGKLSTVNAVSRAEHARWRRECEVVSPVIDHGKEQITAGHGGPGVTADAGNELRTTVAGRRCQEHVIGRDEHGMAAS